MQSYRDQGYLEPDVVHWARGTMPDFDERMRAERGYWFDGDSWQYDEAFQEGQEPLSFAISSEEPPELATAAESKANTTADEDADSSTQVI